MPTDMVHSSVSATDWTAANLSLQLYYGPTSSFALMQTIYRDLIPGYSNNPINSGRNHGEQMEETGDGLDMFQFRSIFFGMSRDDHTLSSMARPTVPDLLFIPYPVAKDLLDRYLSSLYHLTPFKAKQAFIDELDELYRVPHESAQNHARQHMVLLAIGIAALNTEHYRLSAPLMQRVSSEIAAMREVVNIESVQTSLIMISILKRRISKTS